MKPAFVNELQADQAITTFFLVCEKEVRATREGKPYLRLELGDRTGTIEARMWEGFEADAFARDDCVKVQARVENYRNKLQLALEKIRRAEDPEIVPRLKRAPAAKMLHHAYLGGLLEHVARLCGLCRVVAAYYPEPNADL